MSKKLIIFSLILFLVSVLGVGRPYVHAQNSTFPENSGTNTIWNPISLTNNFLTDYFIKRGEVTVFHGTLVNYNYNSANTFIVTTEIYNKQHQRVSHITTGKITLKPFEYFNIERISPKNLIPGQYYYAVGIYDPDTTHLLAWYPGYQHFTVSP